MLGCFTRLFFGTTYFFWGTKINRSIKTCFLGEVIGAKAKISVLLQQMGAGTGWLFQLQQLDNLGWSMILGETDVMPMWAVKACVKECILHSFSGWYLYPHEEVMYQRRMMSAWLWVLYVLNVLYMNIRLSLVILFMIHVRERECACIYIYTDMHMKLI